MKKILKSLIALVILSSFIASYSCVNAATGSFRVSAASTSLTKGKTTSITITAKNCGGQFSISSSNSSVVSVSSSSEWVESGSKKVTITAKGEGSATITVKAQDVADTSENVVSGSKSVTIKVGSSSNNNSSDDNKSSNKSSNANLTTLGITPKDYDFSGFSKDKTSYSVTVPNNVDSLKVNYKTADSKVQDKVKVTGNDNLEVGTNIINVVVTAQDGTTKTYKIKVTKLATEDNKPGNVIDEENDLNLYLTSLSIDGLELSPAFDKNVFSYTTTIDMDTNDMSEVKVNAEANDSKATVEITGNTNLVEGENLINIVVKDTESSEQTVYQITVNKISQASEIASNNIFDKIKNIKREYLIIGGFIFIVVVIIIILIINHIRNKKYYDEMDEDGYYDNNEENENETSNFNERPQDNFIEELYKKRNNGEKLNKQDEETIEDIENENDRIFNKPKKGETVEYSEDTDKEDIEEEQKDEPDFLEERKEKRRKGKHF